MKQMWLLAVAAVLSLAGVGVMAAEEGYNNAYHPRDQSKVMDFGDIDKDNKGYITLDDARKNDPLVARNFHEYDADKSGTLDSAEFSALEDKEPSQAVFWQEFFSRD